MADQARRPRRLAAAAVLEGKHPAEEARAGALAPAVGTALARKRARSLPGVTQRRQHGVGTPGDQDAPHGLSVPPGSRLRTEPRLGEGVAAARRRPNGSLPPARPSRPPFGSHGPRLARGRGEMDHLVGGGGQAVRPAGGATVVARIDPADEPRALTGGAEAPLRRSTASWAARRLRSWTRARAAARRRRRAGYWSASRRPSRGERWPDRPASSRRRP